MSGTQQALGSPPFRAFSPPRRTAWLRPLAGSDAVWAAAFVTPYAAVFVAFIVWPLCLGLWMGHDPALYRRLFDDPLYLTTVANTLLFVAIGVNTQLAGAFLLSGFFHSRSRWRRLLLAVFLLPWALPALSTFLSVHYMVVSQWGLFDSLWVALTGSDGPLLLLSRWSALATDILAYIWKWMPFWTLVFLGARMAIPRELYEAAAVDGARPLDCLLFVTVPLLANLYLVATLLSTLWTLGDFPTVYFISYGAPARQSDVLATYGVRMAFDFGYPRLGVAAMMTALPLLIPVAILLIRRVRRLGVQL